MNWLYKIDKHITKINFVTFNLAAFITFTLLILTFLSVVLRYWFGVSAVWFNELLWHLFGMSFLLSTAYTLKEDGHVRVDIFYNRLSPKTKAVIDLIFTVLFLMPLCVLIIYYGYKYTLSSINYHESSDSPNGLPYRFLIKSVIPIGFFLLFLQSISFLFKQVFTLIDKPSENIK